MMGDYLTINETAELLRVTPQTIRNWLRDGVFPGHRLNPKGQILIKLSNIERAIARGTIVSREEYDEIE